MSEISGNSCNIITLMPLEVECVVTNASTPLNPNGSIQLLINGGTAPYSISWNNGQSTSTLTGLLPGTYSATVTDYYGDYSVTTECVVEYDSFYLDKLIECANISNPNLYVFYDGTSLDETKATEASNSIREWYSGKTDDGFGGLLYEGVIGKNTNNGENWLWWSTYPYLGSLTGGTLSDGSQVKIYGLLGETISHSEADDRWCTNSSGECNPNNVSFNYENSTYQRINRGLNINNGLNDSRSQGLPFTAPSSLNGQGEGIYGDFIGGDTNYIVICITDEADGAVGLYHGRIDGTNSVPVKSDLYNDPFTLKGIGWDTTNTKAPSDRYVGDYERFLKVWEDIVVNEGGSFNGLVYPVCDSSVARIPFVQHSVATIEGETISSSDYTTKYGGSITNVGPENLNLSALTITNVYTALTTNSVYTSLPAQYQQGAGLKNFGWEVDPDVTNFTSTVVGNALDEFFENIQLSDNEIFVLQGNSFTTTPIYSFNEIDGCYQFDSTELWTGQTYSAVTISAQYDNCIECNPSTPNQPPQPTICLTNSVDTNYTFTPTGTDSNGNYTWSNSTNSLTMRYNITSSKWEVITWSTVGTGLMNKFESPVSTGSIPTGAWINSGTDSNESWSVNLGECVGFPLVLSASPSDPACFGGVGSVELSAAGGTPPYQYKINGVSSSYQNSGLFTNLIASTYQGEVLDDNNQTATTYFIINNGQSTQNYTVGFTRGGINTSTNNLSNSTTRSYNYTVTVTPSLPSGLSISFKVKLGHTMSGRGVGNTGLSSYVQFSKSFSVNKNNAYINTTDSTPEGYYDANLNCGDNWASVKTYSSTSDTITIQNGDTVYGTVSTTVNLNQLSSDCNCKTFGDYDTSLQIIDVELTGNNCSSAGASVQYLNMETKRVDCELVTPCSPYRAYGGTTSDYIIYTDCQGKPVTQYMTPNTNIENYISFCSQTSVYTSQPSIIVVQQPGSCGGNT